MRQLLAFAPKLLVAPGTRLLSLTLIACAASITLLAQTENLPADPVPAAATFISAPASGAPATRFGVATPSFGQFRVQPFVLPQGAGSNSSQWSRSMLEPFEPGPNFGNFSRSKDGSNRFGGAAIGGRQDRFGSTFEIGNGNLHGSSSAAERAHSASSIGLPSFDAMMRGNRTQPISPSLGAFRLSNREMPRMTGDAVDFTHPLGSSTIINSDLGNGVLFSAGTGSGTRSAAGAPAASVGPGTPGTKHSGAAVNLKLSF